MSPTHDVWDELRAPPPTTIAVGGRTLSVGQRVRLAPRADADIMDAALAGRSAIIEAIDLTTDGEPHLSVTIDDDPGRDFGTARYPGHRFFFRADEVEIIGDASPGADGPRVLVAGIGNIFFGDDGFGVAVARRLAKREKPPRVTIADFGIRGLDLAYALQDDYDAAILIDAMPRGGAPGTLYVVEPDLTDTSVPDGISLDAHGMDPVRVLQLARSLGRIPPKTVVLGCEPAATNARAEPAPGDGYAALSSPVAAAIDDALRLVASLLAGVASSTPQ